jgi:hypothetical protein
MATTKKQFEPAKLLLVLVPLIFIAAVLIFLFTKTDGVSGVDVLKMEGTWFWAWVVIGIVGAGFFGYKSFKNEDNGGSTGKTILFAILALVLLTSPFGKACTDKANAGVTAPHYQPK